MPKSKSRTMRIKNFLGAITRRGPRYTNVLKNMLEQRKKLTTMGKTMRKTLRKGVRRRSTRRR
jgi:hypothetical protein